MKKLLRVEDIKIEKGDIGFFAHTPEELGIEGNKLRAGTKEELERLIEEAVDRYNEDLSKRSDKYVAIYKGKEYDAELAKDAFGNDCYIIEELKIAVYDGKLKTTTTPTPTTSPTKTQQPKNKPGIDIDYRGR